MKKILSLITILSFGCLYTNAQITDGYYRVQTGKGNFISIVNNKIDNDNYNKVKEGQGGTVYSLRLKKQNEVISDAASIVKITNVTGQGLIIEGQGMNTKDLTTLYLKCENQPIPTITAPEGYNFLYGTAQYQTRYCFDSGTTKTDTDQNSEGETTKYTTLFVAGNQTSGEFTTSSANAYWKFIPIDNETEYYGIAPEKDIKVDGKYYTTVFSSFPFKVTGDMKAYYVTGCEAGKKAAKLNEIEDGIVPAETPVIIECVSENAADNKVIVGVTPTKTYSVTLTRDANGREIWPTPWKATYFCYVKKKGSDGKTEATTQLATDLRNATTYVASYMRVLGVSEDGKLALVKATDSQLHTTDKSKYLRANKAYLMLSGAADTIILGDGIDTGISSVENQQEESSDIFNMKGQKVKATNVDELPHGLYIINGKKVIK